MSLEAHLSICKFHNISSNLSVSTGRSSFTFGTTNINQNPIISLDNNSTSSKIPSVRVHVVSIRLRKTSFIRVTLLLLIPDKTLLRIFQLIFDQTILSSCWTIIPYREKQFWVLRSWHLLSTFGPLLQLFMEYT